MTTSHVGFAIVIGALLLGAGYLAWRLIRRSATAQAQAELRARQAIEAAETRARQARAAVDAPRDRDSLLERLRGPGL